MPPGIRSGAIEAFYRTCYAYGTEKIRVEHHSALGGFWFAGWLFAIGFLGLGFWKGALALVLWPYFLGLAFAL